MSDLRSMFVDFLGQAALYDRQTHIPRSREGVDGTYINPIVKNLPDGKLFAYGVFPVTKESNIHSKSGIPNTEGSNFRSAITGSADPLYKTTAPSPKYGNAVYDSIFGFLDSKDGTAVNKKFPQDKILDIKSAENYIFDLRVSRNLAEDFGHHINLELFSERDLFNKGQSSSATDVEKSWVGIHERRMGELTSFMKEVGIEINPDKAWMKEYPGQNKNDIRDIAWMEKDAKQTE